MLTRALIQKIINTIKRNDNNKSIFEIDAISNPKSENDFTDSSSVKKSITGMRKGNEYI